jgi:predicted phage terminase large subunit-like protein
LRELDRLREIEACRYDIMRFAKRYFTGRLLDPKIPSADFHYDLTQRIVRAVNDDEKGHFLAFAASRSHAKTTMGTVIPSLYCIAFSIVPYIIICNAKQDGAADFLKTIKNEIVSNEKFREDFGDLVGKTWGMLDIVTANGVRVQAVGAGEAMRGRTHNGKRPKLLIIDDLEKDPDVLSPKYRDAMENWLNSTFIPLGDPEKTHVIYLGTTLHPDSVLMRVMKNDVRFTSRRYPAILKFPKNTHLWDEWEKIVHRRDFSDEEVEFALAEIERKEAEHMGSSDQENDEFAVGDETVGDKEDVMAKVAGFYAEKFYEEHKEEMDEGAKVLWKERMSLYSLMLIRATKRKTFLTEYQNQPRDETTILFNQFTYFDLSEIDMNDLDIYGAVDPSLGKTNKSDFSAIVTIGRHRKTGIIYVLDVDAKRRPPDKIIEDVITKARHFDYRGFAVETIQFQALFATDLAKRSALENVYLPIREIKPSSDKWLRIASLEPLVSNGFIRFQKTQRELIDELENVGTNGSLPEHDDRSDALQMAVSLVRENRRRISFGTL